MAAQRSGLTQALGLMKVLWLFLLMGTCGTCLDASARTVKHKYICVPPKVDEAKCTFVRAGYIVIHGQDLRFTRATLKHVSPANATKYAQCVAENWTNDLENPAEYKPKPGQQAVAFDYYLGHCPLEP